MCMNESLACVPTAKQRFSQQKPREGASQIPSPCVCSPAVATVVGAGWITIHTKHRVPGKTPTLPYTLYLHTLSAAP